MESILYNAEKKEVVIIHGYGIGNHLSLNYLIKLVAEIIKMFPGYDGDLHKIPFLPVADSSRRHKHMWYSRITCDLSEYPQDKWGYHEVCDNSDKVYKIFTVTAHKQGEKGWTYEDETAESVMNRMIHD